MNEIHRINSENRRTADYLFFVYQQNVRMTEFDREYFMEIEKSIYGTAAYRQLLHRIRNGSDLNASR